MRLSLVAFTLFLLSITGCRGDRLDKRSPIDSFYLELQNGGFWLSKTIEIQFDRTFNEEESAQLRRAAAIWNEAIGRDYLVIGDKRMPGAGEVNADDTYGDLRNTLYKGTTTFTDEDVLGETYWLTACNRMVEADVWFNFDSVALGDVPGLGDKERELYDLTSLAVHELGHLFGLNHSEQEDSVMSPYMEPNAVIELSDEDVKLARYAATYQGSPSQCDEEPM